MKKILLIFTALSLISSGTFSQKARIGLTAGFTLANYRSVVDGSSESADPKFGITAGFITDLPAGKHFSIQPGIHFIQKGTKDKQTYNGVTDKIMLTINMLEIPVNFLYNYSSPAGNFFIGAGPSLGIGISGKLKSTTDGESNTESVSFGNGESDLLRNIDLGVNVLAGFRFPNDLLIVLNYNLGLNNLVPGGSTDEKLTSRYFGLRLGWMLNKSRAGK